MSEIHQQLVNRIVVRLPTGEFMQIADNYRRVRGLFEQRVEAAHFRRSLINAWRWLSDEQKSGASPWDQALVVGAIMRERVASFVDIAGSRIVRAVSAAQLRRVDEENIDLGPISFPIEPLIASTGRFAFGLDAAGVTGTVVKQPKFEAEFGYERNDMRLASKALQAYSGEFGESLSRLVTSAVKEAALGAEWLSGKEALAGVYAVVVGADAEVKSCRVLEAPRMIGDTRLAHDRRKWRESATTVPSAFGQSGTSGVMPTIHPTSHRDFQNVSLEHYCLTIKSLIWQDRDWLQAVTNAAWRQAQTLRNYIVPNSLVTFPFQQSFAEVGVHSLSFLGETDDRVTVRFDLPRDRYAKLILHRRRHPNLGNSPLQGLLTAIAVTVYRDCVVAADNQIRLGVELARVSTIPTGSEKQHQSRVPGPLTVPRVRSKSLHFKNRPAMNVAVNRHSVVGHLRRLPDDWSASSAQIAEAMGYGLILAPNETFVRPHVRGAGFNNEDSERIARSRNLSAELLGMIEHAVRIA